jgi:hypothetical protein
MYPIFVIPAWTGATAFLTFCETINFDELVKSRNSIKFVIPAKAGIQLFQDVLDPGFRRGDPPRDFLRDHQFWLYVIFSS